MQDNKFKERIKKFNNPKSEDIKTNEEKDKPIEIKKFSQDFLNKFNKPKKEENQQLTEPSHVETKKFSKEFLSKFTANKSKNDSEKEQIPQIEAKKLSKELLQKFSSNNKKEDDGNENEQDSNYEAKKLDQDIINRYNNMRRSHTIVDKHKFDDKPVETKKLDQDLLKKFNRTNEKIEEEKEDYDYLNDQNFKRGRALSRNILDKFNKPQTKEKEIVEPEKEFKKLNENLLNKFSGRNKEEINSNESLPEIKFDSGKFNSLLNKVKELDTNQTKVKLEKSNKFENKIAKSAHKAKIVPLHFEENFGFVFLLSEEDLGPMVIEL